MKKILTLLAIALAALTSCMEEVQYSISIDTSELSFSSAGGEGTVKVTSTADWELSGDSYWCYASEYSGKGDAEIIFTADANADSESSRIAAFTFISGDKKATLTVTQEKKEYSISIEPIELIFGAEGGEQEIVVTSSGEWEVTGESDWCYASVASGVDGDTVKFSVEPYMNTEEARTAIYTFVCGDKAASLNIIQFPDEVLEFEDDNFLQALLKNNRGIDRNGDGKISKSEASTQKSINVYSSNISTMDEIKYFTSLEKLYCYDNQLTSLDVSHNPNLKVLFCGKNQLKSLDVSNNTALTGLHCYDNQLTSLDLSENISLIELFCTNNQLLTINLSKNTALTTLNCEYNQLPFLDLSNNVALKSLSCYSNRISDLDLSQCHELGYVECCQFSYTISNNNYQFFPDYDTKLPLKSLKVYKYHNIDAPYIIALETFYGNVLEYVD